MLVKPSPGPEHLKQDAYPWQKQNNNCNEVLVRRMNNQMWRRITMSNTKRQDLRFMGVHTAITKSALAIDQVAESPLEAAEMDRE